MYPLPKRAHDGYQDQTDQCQDEDREAQMSVYDHVHGQIHKNNTAGQDPDRPDISDRNSCDDKQNKESDEIKRLKAELKRVTQERDILKEAAAFFASESRKDTRS